jgi:2-iminobutanoate/2-iminopropanoate deaminase
MRSYGLAVAIGVLSLGACGGRENKPADATLVAVDTSHRESRMPLKQISTDKAPSAIGPYSQGIIANGFLFTAGQIALDPVAGKIVEGGIVEQTERVMQNLQEVLRAGGASWGDVVKTTVYLHDLSHFPTVNEIYGKWLGDARPARSTVQVPGLPRGALVEIDAVAVVSK